jgi:hypothetical protein
MKKVLMKTVLFIALCGFILSCKKDKKEEVVSFPLELAYNNLSIRNKVRLFTNGQEIKDTAIINKFLGTNKNLFTTEYKLTNMGNLRFLSADTIETLAPPVPNVPFNSKTNFQLNLVPWEIPYHYPELEKLSNYNRYLIIKINDQFICYSYKPIDVFNNQDRSNKLLKYKSPDDIFYNSPLIPSSVNNRYTKRVMVGYGSYNEININYLVCKLSLQVEPDFPTSRVKGLLLSTNEFDENYISSLGATDTLAVTTFSINYKKM